MKKISFGMVIRNFVSPEPLLQFLRNASDHGHYIHSLIVSYSHVYDPAVKQELEKDVKVYVTKIGEAHWLGQKLRALGLSPREQEALLSCPTLTKHNLVPYGFNRNTVLLMAALTGTEQLLFVDSDVLPQVLCRNGGGTPDFSTVDFAGRHLSRLEAGADLTTSEYSGFNILPPANFDEMEALLIGLQKEEMLSFWETSCVHHCLALQQPGAPRIRETGKVLGGNLGMNLSSLEKLPPFFSPYYHVGNRAFLARGEDTIFNIRAGKHKLLCEDIDLHIYHDTYRGFPKIPDLRTDEAVQRRFYYACTGWLGRNPFMNWLRGIDPGVERERREKALEEGALALFRYTGNPLFCTLPENFRAAYDSLPDMIDQYRSTRDAWAAFVERRHFL